MRVHADDEVFFLIDADAHFCGFKQIYEKIGMEVNNILLENLLKPDALDFW